MIGHLDTQAHAYVQCSWDASRSLLSAHCSILLSDDPDGEAAEYLKEMRNKNRGAGSSER